MPTQSKTPKKTKTLRTQLRQARVIIEKLENDHAASRDAEHAWHWQATELRDLLRKAWSERDALTGASAQLAELRELLHAAVNAREEMRTALDVANVRLARAVAVVRAVDATQGAARAVLDEAQGEHAAHQAARRALLCAWSTCEVEAPHTLFCPRHDAEYEAQHGRKYGSGAVPQRGRKKTTT